jgi:hypothetical protein
MPDTGYDIPWGRWSPALLNPIPANVAAMSISLRASPSPGSSSTRSILRVTIWMARVAQTSLMGFDPW